MKKLLLLLVAVFFTVTAHAYDLANNGIYYNKKSDGSLEVVGSSTTNVDIPSSITIASVKYRVTSIGSYAFNGRSDITYLSIPYSIKSIGEYAFMGCGSNITVNISDPESWCKMQLGNEHASPLSSAKKMLVHDIETTSFSVPETVTSIGAYTFYQCSCLKTLYIPGSVTSIGSSAFEDCDYLSSLTLSNGLNSIGGSSFEGCVRLTTLSIPSTVTKIKINAFKRCTNLNKIISEIQQPFAIDENVFNTYSTATLNVPAGTKSAYKSTAGWKLFQNIIEPSLVGQKFKINGFYYKIVKDNIVSVTSGEDANYYGNLVIPSQVTYNGKTYSVTSIEKIAFHRNSAITSVTIPNSVTSIGESAFGACTKLSSITIPNSVTEIGPAAFYGCTALKLVNLPSRLKRIENNLFWGCNHLTSITIPESVTSIAEEAFRECSALSSITIPNSITEISKFTFYKCNSITAVNVPAKVKSIDSSAFEDCNNLTSLTMNEGLESIGGSAFEGCTKLKTLLIPSTVTTIKINAFKNCTSLNTITSNIQKPFAIDGNVFSTYSTATLNVPAGTKSAYQSTAGWKLFQNIVEPSQIGQKFKVHGFYYKIVKDNTVSVTSGDDANYYGDLVIPSQVTYNGTTYSVTSIDKNAFHQNSAITSVTIPNSVTSIGESAFGACTKLSSITIPNSVTEIAPAAFYGCSALKQINLPSRLKRIENNLLWGCNHLTSITIPEGVTSIAEEAFRECSSLPSINIPNSVTEIGSRAFSACSKLKSIVSEIQKPFAISDDVFDGIASDAVLNVPVGTKSAYKSTAGWKLLYNIIEPIQIGQTIKINGFYYKIGKDNTVSVTSGDDANYYGDLVIPSQVIYNGTTYSVTSIDKNAFHRNSAITSVTIPISVTSIGESAFGACTKLSSITIPNSVTEIAPAAFYGCSALKQINLPSRLKRIENNLLWGCNHLTSITIPEGVTSIAEEAFRECSSLPSINIPNSVTEIGSRAFSACTSLKSIVSEIQKPFAISDNVFDGIASDAVLNVPVGTKSAYKSTAGWKLFQSIFEPIQIGQKFKINGIYYKIDSDNTVSVTSGNDANNYGDLVIPSQVTYDGTIFSVTSIEKNAFHRNSAITSMTIPNSVTSIGESAFGACTQLSTVSIPNSVTEIASAAFYGCIALEQVNFPSRLKRIENNLFWGCNRLTSITIPESVTSIAEEAFRECSALPSITIPNSVTVIGNRAFEDCSSLKYIISDIQNPFAISDDVFNGISSDAVLTVPVGTKSAYQSTAGWKLFQSIFEPIQIGQKFEINGIYYKIDSDNTVSVTSGNDANYYGDLVIPSQVTYDGTIFGVTSIEKNAFHRNSAITSMTIPNSVTSIGASSFGACTGLSSITIPNSVTEIGSAAFEKCTNLKLIILGSSVASIGSRAFADINGESNSRSRAENNILKVICKAETVPETASDAFENSQIEYGLLIVPYNAVVAYQAAAPWNIFGNISGEIESVNIDNISLDPVKECIYDLQGNRLVNLRKGVNIIKNDHGEVRKVFVR